MSGRTAPSWHRLLLPAVERATPRLWPSAHIVARVLCDLEKNGRRGVAYGGYDAIVRRSAAYNGGAALARYTVVRGLRQLRDAGLIHIGEPGGRGRRPNGTPRGGRGNANGYVLAHVLTMPGRSYPQALKGHLEVTLSAPGEQGVKGHVEVTPESGTTYPSRVRKERAGVSPAHVVHRGTDESLGDSAERAGGLEPVRHLFPRFWRRVNQNRQL